jgi:Putative abortive phage resistance protein AbiGi, antitoxin
MSRQRYVSKELTHFVGRALMQEMPEEERESREDLLYERLIAILRGGTLVTGGKKTGVNADPSIGKEGITVEKVVSYNVGSTDLQTMFDPAVVCFCDIPVGDVAIHMSKYSPFGLAFSRKFLLGQGANPVLYLAEDAVIDDTGQTNGDLFVDEMNEVLKLLTELQFATVKKPEGVPRFPDLDGLPKRISDAAILAHQFLLIRAFSYVKAFRGDSADENPENFYMEREWRRYGDLEFALEDVCRVICQSASRNGCARTYLTTTGK